MRTSPTFIPKRPDALANLIAAYPLAQVVSAHGDRIEATPLPLIAESAEDGTITSLIGHFARTNPQVAMLRESPRALIIFHGAHGYVSPSWMRDRSQASTWNFETVHFLADLTLQDEEADCAEAIEVLRRHLEDDHAEPWHANELGERYQRLLKGVVAFRATVLEARIKFKLGQNERDDVYEDIVTGLQASGNQDLAQAMETANGRCTHLLSQSASGDTTHAR